MYQSNSIAELSANGVMLRQPGATTPASTHCHNLRFLQLPTGETVLCPVGSPSPLASGTWRPLVAMVPADGRHRVIAASGNNVCEIFTDRPDQAIVAADPQPSVIATLASAPICAIVENSDLYIMTADGLSTWHVDADGVWSHVDPASWPALSLIAVDDVDCESVVAPRVLSTSYPDRSHQLRDVDRRAVTADLCRAYTDIATQASAAGALCTPVIMRYRLIGHAGETLWTSAPLLLGASDSERLSKPISVSSKDRRTLSSYTLSARAWRLRVATSAPIPATMAANVSRIELLATPQFHPFDPTAQAPITMVSEAGSDIMLRMSLPGVGRSISSANGYAAESRLRGALGEVESLERVVAVLQGPLSEGATLDSIATLRSLSRSVAIECQTVEKALAATPVAPDAALVAVSAPHSFSALCGASSSGNSLWANLEAIRFNGFPVESFAASRAGQGAWHAAVAVRFASGDEQVVRVSSGSSGAPILFNPVLSYPAPDAVAMTLVVSSGGVVHTATLPLSPDPSGRRSVYVAPTFAPFALTTVAPAFVVPAVRRKLRPMPASVVFAGGRASPLAVATLGCGTVNDVYVAARSQSSWDFSRPRYSVFSDSGTFTVTYISSRSPSLSVSPVDSRKVVSGAVCDCGGRLLAVAGDSLVEVGVSKLRTLATGVRAEFMAYDPVHKSLWLSAPTTATTTVVDVDSLHAYTRDELLSTRAVGPFVAVSGKLCDISKEDPRSSIFIRWDGDLPLGSDYVRPLSLRLDMVAGRLSYGSLSVRRATHGAAETSPSLRLSVSGRIAASLRLAMRSLPLRRLKFSLQGRASADTIISSLSVNYHKFIKS